MIFDRDVFSRLALYPKFVHPQTGVFDEALLIKFSPLGDSGGLAMSVGSRAELKAVEDVHAFGCRSAVHADCDFERRQKRPPDPETEAHHYLGFYDFEWGAAKSAPLLHHEVSIRFKLEHGELAHFQIEMHRRSKDRLSDGQVRKDRVAMRTALTMGFSGPFLHICERDEPIRPKLEAIAETLPMLPYSEALDAP